MTLEQEIKQEKYIKRKINPIEYFNDYDNIEGNYKNE